MSGLDALTERLKAKLEQNPTDGVGWALLARAYVELGRHPEAVPIYEKAMQLIPDDAQMLADYADALGVLNGRKLEGRPEALIQQALKADPRNVKALMLAGTVAYNHKEFGRAAAYWEEARTNLPPETDPKRSRKSWLVLPKRESLRVVARRRRLQRLRHRRSRPARLAGCYDQRSGDDCAGSCGEGIADRYALCVCPGDERSAHACVDRTCHQERSALHVSAR